MVGVTLEASLPAQVTPVVYHGGGQQWPPLLLPPYTTPTTSHNAYYTALRMLPRVTHGYATSYVTSALVCPQRYMPPRARAPVLPPRTLLVSKGLLYDVEYSPRHHAVIQWGKLKRFCNPAGFGRFALLKRQTPHHGVNRSASGVAVFSVSEGHNDN